MSMRAGVAAALFSVLVATGCTNQSTSSLSTTIDVSANDASLRVTVRLYGDGEGDDDGPDNMVEVDGARFTVAFHGAERELTRLDNNSWAGELALTAPPAADEVITVAFARDDGDDAPASTVTAVPSFTVGDIPSSVSQSAPLTVMWSPASDDPMSWRAFGFCTNAGAEIEPGVTAVTITPDEWMDVGTCAEDLVFARTRTGQLDPAFKDGFVSYRWQQRRSVTLTP